MKKHLFLSISCCLILCACENMSGTKSGTTAAPGTHRPDAMTGGGTNIQQGSRENYGTDNTIQNIRDRNDQSLTPGNQGENEMDRTITQKLRQAIMEDNSLSTDAKNIKIITLNGVVTLRGPVNNEREKNEIAKKARAVNGVRSVDNQIEVSQHDMNNAGSFGNTRSDMERGDYRNMTR